MLKRMAALLLSIAAAGGAQAGPDHDLLQPVVDMNVKVCKHMIKATRSVYKLYDRNLLNKESAKTLARGVGSQADVILAGELSGRGVDSGIAGELKVGEMLVEIVDRIYDGPDAHDWKHVYTVGGRARLQNMCDWIDETCSTRVWNILTSSTYSPNAAAVRSAFTSWRDRLVASYRGAGSGQATEEQRLDVALFNEQSELYEDCTDRLGSFPHDPDGLPRLTTPMVPAWN